MGENRPAGSLLQLCRIAVNAGLEIMQIYESGLKVSIKADASPVTQADVAAENIILKGLARFDGKTPVIAEEAVAGGQRPVAAPVFYLVDPLDGTKEFISRNGEFTVNIALIEQHRPVKGVVYAPARQTLYCGATGSGAFMAPCQLNEDPATSSWQAIHTASPQNGDTIAVISRSHGDEETQNWLADNQICKFITAGSSLKFCLVASGAAHVYPRFGRTMEWDTAAGHAIVCAAGGTVTCLDGKPLLYGKQAEGFANPGFIARTQALPASS